MSRTYTISIQRDPPISGYGGFDEWTLENLEYEKGDELLDEIDKLVDKLGGHFTGVQ